MPVVARLMSSDEQLNEGEEIKFIGRVQTLPINYSH